MDFSHDVNSVESGMRKVAKGILAHGVTSFCPTLVTSTPDIYKKVRINVINYNLLPLQQIYYPGVEITCIINVSLQVINC